MAECLGVSPAQIGKMQNVGRKAIPAVKEAVENGDISIISTANEIAKLNTEEQEELVQQGDLSDIKHKNVKQMNKEKVDTYINFSEDETDGQQSDEDDTTEKVDTYINFSGEPVNVTLSKFIHEHYFELETIFMSYASLTDSNDEIQMIEEFQELLRKVKEAERGKICFGV